MDKLLEEIKEASKKQMPTFKRSLERKGEMIEEVLA
jgi:hypothetical protein